MMLPVVVTEEVFAVVLATADPDVVPLMLLVEVFAVVLANADPDVVPLMSPVVEKGGDRGAPPRESYRSEAKSLSARSSSCLMISLSPAG